MKLTKKFLLAGAIVTVASAPMSWADGKEGGADVSPAVEEPSVTPDDQVVVDEGEVVEGEVTDGEVIDGEVTDGGEAGEPIRTLDGEPVEKGEVTDGEVIELGDPNVYDVGGPEVQRGEDKNLNPDVIFQTTALGGGEAAPVGRSEARFGSDERAAEIETKGSRITAVKAQKKGPVAVVKKGRVFLR